MIDLNAENDPLLFSISVPSGRLVVQWMEVIAAIQKSGIDKEPTLEQVCDAMRKVSRTPEVSNSASDEALFAAFARMAAAADKAGNG
jgi:hypothetical protein